MRDVMRPLVMIAVLALAACAPFAEEPEAAGPPVLEPVAVVVPEVPAGPTMLQMVTESRRFGRLLAALEAAEMTQVLQGPEGYTLFAPTDAAFDALPNSAFERLMAPEHREELRRVLGYHLVRGRVTTADVGFEGATVQTVFGDRLTLTRPVPGDRLLVDRVPVTEGDVAASNGIIQVIDVVLLPPPGS